TTGVPAGLERSGNTRDRQSRARSSEWGRAGDLSDLGYWRAGSVSDRRRASRPGQFTHAATQLDRTPTAFVNRREEGHSFHFISHTGGLAPPAVRGAPLHVCIALAPVKAVGL